MFQSNIGVMRKAVTFSELARVMPVNSQA